MNKGLSRFNLHHPVVVFKRPFLFHQNQKKKKKLHSHRSPSVVGRASHRCYVREDLLLLFISVTRLLPRWSSGSVSGKRWLFQHRFCRLLSPGGDGFSSISIAGFVSPGRDGFSSISIAGFVSSGRDGFSSISIAGFFSGRSTTQSASVVLLASLSKSQRTFSSTRLYVAFESILNDYERL
ncbi:hypothetical protein HID58_080384 [Brassica napus]|uniref:Uncharacterized protein n=1 Tax=Brassica napus TaxID=3708 RepID=A0ABQ7Y7B0_BRANA|nr:hypothetical protein HID58_080384 [Brassica napus]